MSFDPNDPPSWVKRLLERAERSDGAHMRVEQGGAGGAKAISLGSGTFVAPLPEGWSLHPARPYEGRIRVSEGFDLHYRIDSYEDAEAAAAGPRLLAYADEPEFAEKVRNADDVLRQILVSIPGRDPRGKAILWKWVEPFAGTHIRELVLRCPLVDDMTSEHRLSIGQACSEWLRLGGFAPELTNLDRVAHTEKLERVNFEDTVFMRVPRRWKVEVESTNDDGRKLFAVDDPEDRETLWVTSMLFRVTGTDPSAAQQEEFLRRLADDYWSGDAMPPSQGWRNRRREEIAEGDILIYGETDEESQGEPLRRRLWLRAGMRDEYIVVSPIYLCTATRFLDEPEQVETEALMDREVRNAILSRPPRAEE